MPLTKKGHEIMSNMKKEYGSKKGESVFYASKNAGKIHGVDKSFYGHLQPESKHIITSTDGTKPISPSHIYTDKQGTYC